MWMGVQILRNLHQNGAENLSAVWATLKANSTAEIRVYINWTKKKMYIKFSLKLHVRIFHSSKFKECIDIYNFKYFKVYMTYRGAR